MLEKETINAILKSDETSVESKNLIQALLLELNAKTKIKASAAIPDLYQLKADASVKRLENDNSNDDDNTEEKHNLAKLVKRTQDYLRENHLKAFSQMGNSETDREVVEKLIDNYILTNGLKLEGYSSSQTIHKIQDEILDFGQLNDLIYNRDEIEEIRLNGNNDPVRVMIKGQEYLTDIVIPPNTAYLIAERMCRNSLNAKPLRKDNPFTRTRLGNSIRVTVITDPIAREQDSNDRVVQMIIRKQNKTPFSGNFLKEKTINEYGYLLISAFLRYGLSTAFYGGTNCGKTGTLRSFLDSALPSHRRGITIAEIDEMNLRKINPITKESENEILMWELNENLMNFRQSVNAALTCSPETIVLQEMKGEECVEVIDASITGHQTVVTLHAEDVNVFSERVLQMYKQSKSDIADSLILKLTCYAFPIIIKMEKLADGTRRITSIDELVSYDKKNEHMQSLNYLRYVIDDTIYDLDKNGNEIDIKKVVGHYETENFISERLIKKMKKGGMSNKMFEKLKTAFQCEKNEIEDTATVEEMR